MVLHCDGIYSSIFQTWNFAARMTFRLCGPARCKCVVATHDQMTKLQTKPFVDKNEASQFPSNQFHHRSLWPRRERGRRSLESSLFSFHHKSQISTVTSLSKTSKQLAILLAVSVVHRLLKKVLLSLCIHSSFTTSPINSFSIVTFSFAALSPACLNTWNAIFSQDLKKSTNSSSEGHQSPIPIYFHNL